MRFTVTPSPGVNPDDAADVDGSAFGKAHRHLTGPNFSGDSETIWGRRRSW